MQDEETIISFKEAQQTVTFGGDRNGKEFVTNWSTDGVQRL